MQRQLNGIHWMSLKDFLPIDRCSIAVLAAPTSFYSISSILFGHVGFCLSRLHFLFCQS